MTGAGAAKGRGWVSLVEPVAGYALDIALVTLAGWPGSASVFSTGSISSAPGSPFILAKGFAFCLAFFAWFAVAMRGGVRFYALLQGRASCWVFSALFMAGGLLGLVPVGGDATALQTLCGILMGVGLSGNFTLWVSYFSSLDAPADARAVLGGTLAGGLVYFLLAWLPDAVVCLVSIFVMAPGTSLLLMRCVTRAASSATRGSLADASAATRGRLADASAASRERRPVDAPIDEGPQGEVAMWGGSVRFARDPARRRPALAKGILSLLAPCVTIGAIGVVMYLARIMLVAGGLSDAMVGSVNSLGMVASGTIALVVFEANRYRLDMNVFYRVAVPVIAAAELGLPLLGRPYGYVLVFALYTVFSYASILGILACNQAARHYRIPPVAMYALVFGIIYTMRQVATLFTPLAPSLATGQDAELVQELACALFAVALMLAVYVLSDRYRDRQDTARVYSWESELEPQVPRLMRTANDAFVAFGEHFGLTGREVEVFVLLARGRSAPSISEQLGISRSTVQFHCKNIYAKLGVHNRQEMLDMIDAHVAEQERADAA